MDPGGLLRTLVPPRCVVCRAEADPDALICGGCVRALNSSPMIRADPPEGVDRIVSCADHDGVPRDLLAAFKFRRMVGLADLIAGFMADAVGGGGPDPIVVPVPPAVLRTWFRGFDPVAVLAARVAERSGFPEPPFPVLRRRGSRRQRGRGRGRRLADPPRIEPVPAAGRMLGGRPVLLVDDVMTTGSTLEATAAAVRKAGSDAVRAVTFTRRL